jgi:CYTH domain-containing protein
MKERDTYKENLERLNQSIAIKSKELTQKIKEVDTLKQKYEIALNKMENQKMTEKVIKKKIIKTNRNVRTENQEFFN